MMSKAYPNYKPSGVEWLGDVPEHWEVKALRYICRIETGDKDTVDAEDDGEHPFFVRSQTIERINTYTKNCEAVLTAGDGVGVGKVFHYINGKFDFHQRVYTFSNFKKVTGRFFFHFLKENFWRVALEGGAKSTVDSLRRPMISSFLFIIPPLPEQQAIAAFLDRETGRIDSLIAKKQRLLQLLTEQRTALISRVVTKGLDESVKLKPSGVEWLGDVPEHWGMKRLKHVFPRLLSGVSTNSESSEADEIELGVLKTSCVYGNKFIPSENKKIVDNEISRASCPVRKNSLIISRMNTPKLVGNCGYVDRDYSNLFLPDRLWIATFTNKSRISSKYAWFLIVSDAYVKLTGSLATGTSDSMKNLSQDAFLNMAIPLPPLPEQQAIAAYLDGETAKIDKLSAKVVTVIEQLKEYRTALISSAVTGKIDVQEAV